MEFNKLVKITVLESIIDKDSLNNTDKKDELKALMHDINVSYKLIKYDYHFPDDTQKRNIVKVYIKRNNILISFNYGMSIQDSQSNKDLSLYDILVSIKLDYSCPDTFKDFCNEYGYDIDSIKSLNTFKTCIKHSAKLRKIFGDIDINCLPY